MPKLKNVSMEQLQEYANSLFKFPTIRDMEACLDHINNNVNDNRDIEQDICEVQM